MIMALEDIDEGGQFAGYPLSELTSRHEALGAGTHDEMAA